MSGSPTHLFPTRALALLSVRATRSPVNRYVAKEAADGTVWIKGMSTLTVTISEPFDLRAFPFDFQDVNIMLVFDNVKRIEPWLVPIGTFATEADESRGFLARDQLDEAAATPRSAAAAAAVAESEQRRRTRVQALRDGTSSAAVQPRRPQSP